MRIRQMAYVVFPLFALIPVGCLAAIDLSSGFWTTSFDCPNWNQPDRFPSCDGLSWGGNWYTKPGGHGLQITDADNNPLGMGKCGRKWYGDGQNNNGGDFFVDFGTAYSNIWVRFYFKYQLGFKWSSLGYHKLVYFSTGPIVEWVKGGKVWDGVGFVQGGTHRLTNSGGWDRVMKKGAIDRATGQRTSDGQWHYLEFNLNSANGTGKIWVDGALVLDGRGMSFSPLRAFKIPSNSNRPNNGTDMYYEIDDIAVSTLGYIGPLKGSGSNPQ